MKPAGEVTSFGHNDTIVIELVGDFDISTAPQVQCELATAFETQPSRIVIDLSRVTFMDSTGLSALITAHKRERKSVLVMVVPDGPVRRLLSLTGTESVLNLVSDRDAALGWEPAPSRER